MKKIFLLLTLAAYAVSNLSAQDSGSVQLVTTQQDTTVIDDASSNILSDFFEFVLDRNKKKDKKKNYAGWDAVPYFSFGFVVGNLENTDAKLIHGASYSLDFGIKTIYRVSGLYALTFNTGFMHNRYKISDGIVNNIIENPITVAPANFVINSECFRTWGFGISIGNKFNFYKTKHIGNYIELSLYGNYTYSRRYLTSYKGENDTSATVDYKNSKLFLPFEAGAQANLGFRWFNVWGRYRLTNCFESAQTNVKLPRFVVGLGVTL